MAIAPNSSDQSGYSRLVSRARNWLQEERRRAFGDWVAFCLRCRCVQRYFEEYVGELPAACTQCGGAVRSQCPSCGARFASAFAVECEACGGELRPPEQFGVKIRKA